MTDPKSELQSTERACYDALAAMSYALSVGMIGAVTIRANHGATMVSLMPKDMKTAKAEDVRSFAAGTVTEAVQKAGEHLDHVIHMAGKSEGADIQPYLRHKAAAQELRKKALIVTPRN